MLDTNADEREIRELVETWMDASRRGDVESVLDLMADDMIFMVPGREPFGKDEFRAMSQAMSGVEVDGRADIRELRVLGDWAWIRNHIQLTVTPKGGGEPVRRAGYTLSIFEKGRDGRWRLARDANLVT
jgi:uncharacterized protein (TIGR02246 family)